MFRVVIADDEETIRSGLKKLIESYDLNLTVVAVAKDGEEALQFINKYRPEIILMDINMPFMSGLEAIEEIKKVDSEAKIIIISGYDQFNYAQKALELGVYSYVLKPIQFREFKNTIVKAMDSYCKRMWELNKIKDSDFDLRTHESIGCQVVNFIKEHFTQNDLTLKMVADNLHISQSYIAKIVKQQTGYSFTCYLNNLKINMASKILLDKDKSSTINEIAEMVGYSSQHYFSRTFKNYTGMSPMQYKSK